MLYLFGRLALSDSLFYHEDFLEAEFSPGPGRGQDLAGPRADARAAAVSRRLRRSRHFPPAGRAAADSSPC